MTKATLGRKLGTCLLAAMLICGLAPFAPSYRSEHTALAEDTAEPTPGTYREHEAIAYVLDGDAGRQSRSRSASLLDGAETLMDIGAQAPSAARGRALSAPTGSDATGAESAANPTSRTGQAGRLVLVRNESMSTQELMAALQADPRVVFAEPNYLVASEDDPEGDAAGASGASSAGSAAGNSGTTGGSASADTGQGGANNESGYPAGEEAPNSSAPSADATSNAAAEKLIDRRTPSAYAGTDKDSASYQWGMSNTGSALTTSPENVADKTNKAPDIDYADWNQGSGFGTTGNEVVVAVIDSGIDAANPDLADKMWTWSAQEEAALSNIPGADKHGFSAAPSEKSYEGLTNGHGTHCAGLIAAEWDGLGVSGVSQNARLMAVHHNDDSASILSCMGYVLAAKQAGVNVRITSNSWGLGATQSRAVDTAVRQLGESGIASLFATGNNSTNLDYASGTVTTLVNNPYVVAVDSIGVAGNLAAYSNYGAATSDIVSPGSASLSTWLTKKVAEGANGPNYLGEVDPQSVLYESFDGASKQDARIAGTLSIQGGTETADAFFDGSKSVALHYTPQEGSAPLSALSSEIDLSQLDAMPRYLSVHTAVEDDLIDGQPTMSTLSVYARALKLDDEGGVVKDANGKPVTELVKCETQSKCDTHASSWGSYAVELPANTDWEHFQLRFDYATFTVDMTGGSRNREAAESNLLIDGIGMGSTLTPYAYENGTSMACPTAAGVAAVLIERDPSMSAAELAALMKGATEHDGAYEGICETAGLVSLDGAAAPRPAVSLVTDGAGGAAGATGGAAGTFTVTGFFFGDNPSVSVDGTAVSATAKPSDALEGATDLVCVKPEGFATGTAEVRVTAADGSFGRAIATLAGTSTATLWDNPGLSLPEEAFTWGNWDLVGYAGDVYLLPRTDLISAIAFDAIYRYDAAANVWIDVALPTADELAGAGLASGYVGDVTATTVGGKLLVQLCDTDKAISAFWWLSSDGSWSYTGCTLSAEEEPFGAGGTLVSDGERVWSFGHSNGMLVSEIDVDGNSSELCGQMPQSRTACEVAYHNGTFAVAGGFNQAAQVSATQGVALVTFGEAGEMSYELVDASGVVTETGSKAWSVAATANGFALVGPQANEASVDTYFMDESGTVRAWSKTASERVLMMPSLLAYAGQLYLVAGTNEGPFRLFASTAAETLPQPGDYVEPAPDPSDPGEPSEPGDPGEPSEPNGNTPLAQTGDGVPLQVAATASLIAVAALALALGALARRGKAAVKR